jgi:hypothetical protein
MSAVSSNFRGAVFMFAIVELSAQAVKPEAASSIFAVSGI